MNGTNGTRPTRHLKPGINVPLVAFFHPETEDVDIESTKKHAIRLAQAGLTSRSPTLLASCHAAPAVTVILSVWLLTALPKPEPSVQTRHCCRRRSKCFAPTARPAEASLAASRRRLPDIVARREQRMRKFVVGVSLFAVPTNGSTVL